MIDTIITIAFCFSTFLTIIILLLPSQYGMQKPKEGEEKKVSVQILVLGDIGRSPRMQYHALSIARHGGHVQFIGYQESELHPDIASSDNISVIALPPHPAILQTSNKVLFLLFAPLKVIFQILSLWICLAYRTKPAKWLLVQNPPSIPTLAVASIICRMRQTHLVVDWHNFGYSILALKLGAEHPLVRFSAWYEKTFCTSATAHFCVTEAMVRVLRSDFPIPKSAPILALHDRPARHFRPIADAAERRSFLLSLPECEPALPALRDGRLRVLVSSTSWTADEDFSLLIDALCRYSELAAASASPSSSKKESKTPILPSLLVIITGKGPQKQHYLNEIEARRKAGQLDRVTIQTAWLSTSDYAKLLASADLGISLHTSSSGVDLPMKVVDMFGAGLPVVGWNKFEAWPELVTENVNGRGFGSTEHLVQCLVELLGGDGDELTRLREGAVKESKRRWDDEWDPVAGRLFGLLG